MRIRASQYRFFVTFFSFIHSLKALLCFLAIAKCYCCYFCSSILECTGYRQNVQCSCLLRVGRTSTIVNYFIFFSITFSFCTHQSAVEFFGSAFSIVFRSSPISRIHKYQQPKKCFFLNFGNTSIHHRSKKKIFSVGLWNECFSFVSNVYWFFVYFSLDCFSR